MAQIGSPFASLWIDRSDAVEQAHEKWERGVISEDELGVVSRFCADGYCIIENAIEPALIDRYLEHVSQLFATRADLWVTEGPDVKRLGEAQVDRALTKVLDTHMVSRHALQMAFAPNLHRILKVIFEAEPAVHQSLHFQVGSTQAIHQDTAYVVIKPALALAAAWIALEDVKPGSGELIYYSGSHRLNDFLYPGNRRHWSAALDGHDIHNHHLAWLHEETAKSGMPLKYFRPKKGDLLLWHADLAHGGSPIINDRYTRQSLVLHYCPITARPAYFDHDGAPMTDFQIAPEGAFASSYYPMWSGDADEDKAPNESPARQSRRRPRSGRSAARRPAEYPNRQEDSSLEVAISLPDGEAASDPRVNLPAAPAISPTDRVVFSTLYNETDEFIRFYIDNFIAFTGNEAVLFVNLPPGREIDFKLEANHDRIFIFNGTVQRQKEGHTLLIGHLEAFDFALRRLGEFGHFCPLASNSLLARRFDREAAILGMGSKGHEAKLDLDELPNVWAWPTVRKNPRFISFLRQRWGLTHVFWEQIEGLFAARDDWALLHDRFNEIIELGDTIEKQSAFPLEEVLPVTMFTNFGSGKYSNICHVFWDRRSYQPRAQIDDLLSFPATAPPALCALKWFERSQYAVETAAVTQPWSRQLFHGLWAAMRSDDVDYLVSQRLLLENLASSLRSRERFVPISKYWWPDVNRAAPRSAYGLQRICAKRQMIHLPIGNDDHDQTSAAYLFLEDTQHDLELAASIEREGVSHISISCSCPAADDLSIFSHLEGYLYLNPLMTPRVPFFRLRLPLATSAETADVTRRIVIARNNQYYQTPLWHVTEASGYREYYYRYDGSDKVGDVWFGIPFFANSTFNGLLDILENDDES